MDLLFALALAAAGLAPWWAVGRLSIPGRVPLGEFTVVEHLSTLRRGAHKTADVWGPPSSSGRHNAACDTRLDSAG